MPCSIFNGQSLALKIVFSNPRFTLDLLGNADLVFNESTDNLKED